VALHAATAREVLVLSRCYHADVVLFQHYELSEDADGGSLLSFNIPRDANDGIVNNRKELFKFRLAVFLH